MSTARANHFNDTFDITKEQTGYGRWSLTLYYPVSGETFKCESNHVRFIDDWKNDDGTRNEENAVEVRNYILLWNGVEDTAKQALIKQLEKQQFELEEEWFTLSNRYDLGVSRAAQFSQMSEEAYYRSEGPKSILDRLEEVKREYIKVTEELKKLTERRIK